MIFVLYFFAPINSSYAQVVEDVLFLDFDYLFAEKLERNMHARDHKRYEGDFPTTCVKFDASWT